MASNIKEPAQPTVVVATTELRSQLTTDNGRHTLYALPSDHFDMAAKVISQRTVVVAVSPVNGGYVFVDTTQINQGVHHVASGATKGKQIKSNKTVSNTSNLKKVVSGGIKKTSTNAGGVGGSGGTGGSGSGGGGKGDGGGKKRGRARTACDRCRRVKMRCDGTRPVCELCRRNGHTCVWPQ